LNEIVVDASALGSVLLTDEDEMLGRLALEVWSEGIPRAPVHWPVEVISILVKAERNKRISAGECDRAWASAITLIQSCAVETSTASRAVFAIARAHGLGAQDAAYVELAHRLKLPLLTGDEAMARAAKALSIELTFDPS
jgi:predicted nucleic acid-binding protein